MKLGIDDKVHLKTLVESLRKSKANATTSMKSLQAKAKSYDDQSEQFKFYLHLYKQMVQTVKNIGNTVNELDVMLSC